MGYQDRNGVFEDAVKLFEAAFNQPKVQRVFLKAGAQSLTIELPYGESPLSTYIKEPLTLEYFPAEDPEAKCFLYWKSLVLPVMKVQVVAEIRLVSSKGEVLKQVPLLAAEGVNMQWSHRWFTLFSSHYGWILSVWGALVLIIAVIAWRFWNNH